MTDWQPAVGEKVKMFIAVSIAITTLKYQKEYKMTKLEPWMTELMAKVKYQKYDEALELPRTKDLRGKAQGILEILGMYVWTEFEERELENTYSRLMALAEKYEGYWDE